jgi:hypothetical protein
LLLYLEQQDGGRLLILDLFGKPKLTVELSDAGIIITMPGTGFSVIYVRTGDNKLVASYSLSKGVGLTLSALPWRSW